MTTIVLMYCIFIHYDIISCCNRNTVLFVLFKLMKMINVLTFPTKRRIFRIIKPQTTYAANSFKEQYEWWLVLHTKLYIYIYIYIKWTVFVNVTTKSAQHAHARMIAIIVEKSPNSSHMYDHGFMDNTNRQAVKNWLDSQTRDASLTSWRQPFCNYKMAASMT